jgi:HEAT repeat protein
MLAKVAIPIRQKLKNMLKDPVADVRIAAAEALYKIGDKKESLKLLINEIKTKNNRTQLHALNILDALGDDNDAVTKEIIAAISGRWQADPYCHKAAVQLIKKLKPGWEDYQIW